MNNNEKPAVKTTSKIKGRNGAKDGHLANLRSSDTKQSALVGAITHFVAN